MIYSSGFQPMGHRSILQWATEQFGLKKSYLHDELFCSLTLPESLQKVAANGELTCFFVFFLFGDHPFSIRKKRLNANEVLFFFEIICFRPEKPFQSNSRLMKIWVKFV